MTPNFLDTRRLPFSLALSLSPSLGGLSLLLLVLRNRHDFPAAFAAFARRDVIFAHSTLLVVSVTFLFRFILPLI